MERGLKGYIVTGEDYLLQTYDSAFFENNILLTELSSSLPHNSSPLKKLDEIKKLYNKWVEDFAKPVIAVLKNEAFSKSSSSPKLQDILKEEEIVNKKLQQEFRELLNSEYENRAKRRVLLEKSEQKKNYFYPINCIIYSCWICNCHFTCPSYFKTHFNNGENV